MGIVNVSPDSFSGDGTPEANAAAARALALLEAGSDLIDVGAESTRPGHVPIDQEVELKRLIPVVRQIRTFAPRNTIVSIDTFKPAVFRAAHAAGGDILNSVWGLNDELSATAAELGVPVVIMHNKAVAVF
jgi:dihydropteroate synthase